MSKICNSALQAHNEKFHIMKNSTNQIFYKCDLCSKTFKENNLVFNPYRWKCTYCRDIHTTEQVLKGTSKQFTQNYIQHTQLKENPVLTMWFYVRVKYVQKSAIVLLLWKHIMKNSASQILYKCDRCSHNWKITQQ